MTKKEHDALQKVMNTTQEYREKANQRFKRLQELNATEGTGIRWCSAEQNYKDLLSVGKDYGWIYREYIEAQGIEDGIIKVGVVLANLGFWK